MAETQYIINGVNMARATLNTMGWFIMRDQTAQLTGVSRSVSKVTVPGYDGYFVAPSTRTEQVMVFNIRSPRANLESLMAMLQYTGYDPNFPNLGVIELTTSTGKAAYYDLVSAIPASDEPNDVWVNVTTTLNIPYGGWRDKATTETDTSITTNPQTITTLAPGISLPIRDMDLFIQGNVGTMQITDSGGSWLRTTAGYVYASGYGIFYQGATGRAFSATTSAPWVAVQDISFAVDTSGGGFKMTPQFDPTVPATRSVSLNVLTTTLTGITLKARLRGAYVLR